MVAATPTRTTGAEPDPLDAGNRPAADLPSAPTAILDSRPLQSLTHRPVSSRTRHRPCRGAPNPTLAAPIQSCPRSPGCTHPAAASPPSGSSAARRDRSRQSWARHYRIPWQPRYRARARRPLQPPAGRPTRRSLPLPATSPLHPRRRWTATERLSPRPSRPTPAVFLEPGRLLRDDGSDHGSGQGYLPSQQLATSRAAGDRFPVDS